MALDSREQLNSRTVEYRNDMWVGHRVYKVRDDDVALTQPGQVRLAFGSGAPDSLPTLGEGFPEMPDMRMIEVVRLELAQGHNNLFEVDFLYESLPAFTEYHLEDKPDLMDVWRKEPNLQFPQYGNLLSQTMEVDGTAVDIAGEPQSMPWKQQTFEITQHFWHSSAIAESTQTYGKFVNKRNADVFFGCGIGTLVYLGARTSRVSRSKIAVTHQFVWDGWYHLRQTPRLDINGIPELLISNGGTGIPTAHFVYWRQPFPETTNFAGILGEFN